METQDTTQTISSAQSEKIKEEWTEVTVGFWSEPEVGEAVKGKIIGVETFESDDGESYAYKIEGDKGSIHYVGQGNAIRALDQIHRKYKDVEVYIEFTGKSASGAYNFDIVFNEDTAIKRDKELSNIPEGQ